MNLLDEAHANTAEAGGKARHLALLRHHGLPVPDFLVIPALWSAGRGGEFPPGLDRSLADALATRGWLDLPLAVRSSAIGEDGADASFAGIHRSCLNVRGLPALTEAIAAVWASLDTPAAEAYRARAGLSGTPAMAVVLMPLLAAESAGIGFTSDPLSGREDRLVVHAHWGLGEALVSGEAAGDEYVFAEDSVDAWRLTERRAGSKSVMRVAARDGGTALVPTAPARAGLPVLNREQAEALAALLRDAALALDYTAPFFDLEWAHDGSRFWLLQARPVTRRPRHTYPTLKGQPAIWTRGNTCEIMPAPLQPMDWNFSRRGVNHLLEQGWKLAGYPLMEGVQRAKLFRGRLYLEAAIMQWEAWDAIGLAPERFNALMGGHQPAIPVPPPGWRQRSARLLRSLRYVMKAPATRRRGEAAIQRMRSLARRALRAPMLTDAHAWQDWLSQLSRPAREEFDLFFLQGSGGGSLALLLETLDKAFPGEGQAITAALLAGGEPSVTARQGYALLDLARKAARAPAPAQDDPDFSAALQAFLAEYGHRGHYETYFRAKSWRMAPELLLAQLPGLAGVDEEALRARQRAASESARQRLRAALPLGKRLWVQALVQAARRECNQREAARSALIAHLDAGRHAWLGAGAWLVEKGLLGAADDVFWLFPSEIGRTVEGQLSFCALAARIEARRRVFGQWEAQDAPDHFVAESADGGVATACPASPVQAHDAAWRGVPTGTGVGRGRVCILRHPDEGERMQAGDILVAPSTDPGWTHLFLKTAGLVVETGGYLSHGAIVAREFALPTVVNLPGIMGCLRDGDEVEVDGTTGQVRRIAP